MIDEKTGRDYEILEIRSEFFTLTVMHNAKVLHNVTFCGACLPRTMSHKTIHSYRPSFYNLKSSECSICHGVSVQRAKDLLVLTDDELIDLFHRQEIAYSPIRDKWYKLPAPSFNSPLYQLKGKG